MTLNHKVAWSLALFVCLSAAMPASAQLATFQDGVNGYTGTQDTTLTTKSLSNPGPGSVEFVTVDEDDDGHQAQGALKFENIFQSQGGLVPDSGVLIGFASVQLWIDSASEAGAVLSLNRVLNETWDESTATWQNLGGDTIPDPNTGLLDGDPILQDDVESLATALSFVPDPEAEDQIIEIDVRDDFLAWYNDPTKTNNQGWGINNTTDNGWDFFTSEYIDAFDPNDFSKRPKLTVAWVIEPGDFDLDSDVDPNDYNILLENMAIQLDGPIEPGHPGDLDFDRDVDLDDFELFKGFFEDFNGITLAAALAGVPEPSTAVLCSILLGSCLCRRSRYQPAFRSDGEKSNS